MERSKNTIHYLFLFSARSYLQSVAIICCSCKYYNLCSFWRNN